MYGLYLLNGGRKEDFLDLDPYDIQIMSYTHTGMETKKVKDIADLFRRG